jgi:hypothetical protein
VSAPLPPSDDAHHQEAEETDEGDRARATAALHEAFTRLQPQGSDAWNFLAAFTHLGDRYGPYQPGASALSGLLGDAGRGEAKPRGRRARLRPGHERPRQTDGPTELEEAMAQVVEAFRFLSARVRTLEERLAGEDRPVDGAAWLAPARELDALVEPVASYLSRHVPGGEVLHGDCGTGALLRALQQADLVAHGVEPRGAVALSALEGGCSVSISELADELAARPGASLGGLVLSGVVDRLPLHALLDLLAQARRVLDLGAPLVVITDPGGAAGSWDPAAIDLIGGRPLHTRTWEIILDRAGFTAIAPLPGGEDDGRVTITASSPP